MSERRIHSMWHMIAIRDGTYVLAVFQNNFAELVEKLLPDLDAFERISFKMAVSVSTVGTRAHAAKVPEWERTFIARLKQRMSEVGHLLTFDVSGEEIPKYLPDFLEGYRGNHIDTFAFAVDEFHGSGGRVLTIEVFDSPSALQRLTKSVREPIQKFVVPLRDLKRIAGTSMQMELSTTSGVLRLARNGLVVAGGAHAG